MMTVESYWNNRPRVISGIYKDFIIILYHHISCIDYKRCNKYLAFDLNAYIFMLMQRKSSDINKNNKDMSKFHIFYNVATIFLKKNYQYKIYLFWLTLNRASFSVRSGVAMVTWLRVEFQSSSTIWSTWPRFFHRILDSSDRFCSM